MSDDGEEWKGEPTFDVGEWAAKREREDPFWMGYFILDDEDNPKPVADVLEWGRWLETNKKHLGQTLVGERIWVSTVFLGLDHSYARYAGLPHKPLLWETMSFWHGEYDPPTPVTYEMQGKTFRYERANPKVEIPENQERYSSKASALKGHRRHVAIATRLLQELDAKMGADFAKPKKP